MTTAVLTGIDRPPDTALFRLIIEAGVRYRPLNRARPVDGHWILDCPECGAVDALWVNPGGQTFETTCACWTGTGGVIAMYHLMSRSRG